MRLWTLVVLVGCIRSNSQTCEDGRVCPADSTCDVAHRACVTPDQTAACVGLDDADACTVPGRFVGHCDTGECLPCGDGVVTAGEACDDGNLADRDGCSSNYGTCDPTESCRSCPADCACTAVCGDLVCDPGEVCPGDCP